LAGLFAKRKVDGLCGTASRTAVAAVLIAAWLAPNSTESAVANGDTRTVVFSNDHTNEQGSFTYMVNGVYDQAVFDKLNWFMRDWRLNEPTKMDPHLFDIIWEVYRESGSTQPIDVLSGYRSPQTNAMLRRRSRQVAEHSQHMEGRAIDAHFVDVGPARIRDIAMRMEEGGVGFYPTGVTWVHIDSGSVRYWPRMSRDALTRLFPDGKTVFIPSDGQPMPGYEQARAEIEARGGEIQTAGGGGLFGWLFGARGGGADDAEEEGGQEAIAMSRGGRNGGGAPAAQIAEAGPDAVARAKRNLPTGPAYASAPAPAPIPAPAPAAAPTPTPTPKPEVVAALEEPNVESDASPDAADKPHGPVAALFLAPLPPRRPANLDQIVALANVPLPPMRPADLVVAAAAAAAMPPVRPPELFASSAPDTTGSTAPLPLPPVRPASLVVEQSGEETGATGVKTFGQTIGVELFADAVKARLPKAITAGAATPSQALALTEAATGAEDADNALLARASELTAPLPPMPIPSADQPSTIKSVTGLSLGEVSKLFGSLPFDVFKTAAPKPAELRGSQ
jgi:uncharacterized protein YcbK (DUF882 family)